MRTLLLLLLCSCAHMSNPDDAPFCADSGSYRWREKDTEHEAHRQVVRAKERPAIALEVVVGDTTVRVDLAAARRTIRDMKPIVKGCEDKWSLVAKQVDESPADQNLRLMLDLADACLEPLQYALERAFIARIFEVVIAGKTHDTVIREMRSSYCGNLCGSGGVTYFDPRCLRLARAGRWVS